MTEQELRQAIVDETKSFVGTPYHDRASLKGVGVDCATFAMLVMQKVGCVPDDYKLPRYYPQQWLKKGVEDSTYLNEVLKFAVEIDEKDAKDGDLILYKIVMSYTHGTIMIGPTMVAHAWKDRGVSYADRDMDQVLKKRPRRYFSFVKKKLGI